MVDTSMEAPVISSTATKYISRRTITDKEKKDIKEAFDLFDTNHDGFINYHELKVAIRALGFDMNKREVQKIINDYGDQDNRSIQWLDFNDIMIDMYNTRGPKENINRAFQIFDYDNSGRITLRKLRRIAKEVDENLSEEELKGMIKAFDLNNDGEIDLDEFHKIMNNKDVNW